MMISMVYRWWWLLAPLLTVLSAENPISSQAGCVLQCHLNCSTVSNTTVSRCDCQRNFNNSFNVCTRSLFECPTPVTTGCFDKNNFIKVQSGNWSVPFQAVYLDSHQLEIRFDPPTSSIATVAEYRANGGGEDWKYAGDQDSLGRIVFRIPNVCHKYELRLLVLFTNGTYIASQASRPGSSPELRIDTLQLVEFYYDNVTDRIIANYSWSSPFEFDSDDILYYKASASPTSCSLSGGIAAISPIVTKTDQGGTASISLPRQAAELKCHYAVDISAMTVCGKNLVGTSTHFLEIDCLKILNFKCPFDQYRKPECAPWVTTQPIRVLNGSVDVQVTWPKPSKFGVPIYYYIRYGPAVKKHLHFPPFPFGFPFGPNRTRPFAEPLPFPEGRRPPPFPFAEPLPFPEGHLPPPFLSNRERDKSGAKDEDDGSAVWIIPKGREEDVRSDANHTTALVRDLKFQQNYGILVCAIFNKEFKEPKWGVQPLHPFRCFCTQQDGPECKSSSARCVLLNATQNNSPFPPVPPPLSNVFEAGMIPTLVDKVPSIINSVRHFTQQLLGVDKNGMRMRLLWEVPEGMQPRMVKSYGVKLATVLDENCTLDSTCCAFADGAVMTPQPPNKTSLDFLVPSSVVAAKCQFLAKISTAAVNGASSATFKNLLTPSNGEAKSEFSPSLDYTTVSCGDTLNCSHSCNGKRCFCPPGMILTADGRNCESVCKAVHNCSYSCDPKGRCTCPGQMQLNDDEKTCVYQDADPTVASDFQMPPKPSPKATRLKCALIPDELNMVETEPTSRTVSMNISWANLLLSADNLDTVTFRWGPIQWPLQLSPLQFISVAENVTIPSNPAFIVLRSLQRNVTYGIQLCAYTRPLNLEMDIVVPHLIRKASDVSVSETSSFKEESEGDVKVIVMAVLIPICAIVILISGVILICHFHPDASKRWLAVLKGRKRCKRKADVADCVTKFTRHSLVFPQFKNAGDRPERIQVPAEMFPAGERPKSVRCKSVSDEKQLEDQHENQTSQPAETVLPTSVKRDPDG